MSNIDKQALRERYSPKPAPECHICGKEMTIQRMSASRITYGCTGATYDDKGCHYAEGRSIADDHYEQSRVTVVDVSDPDVLALLDENIQLQREKDAIEAVALALRDDMRQAREQLEESEKRNVELESKNGYLRTIAHEQNELAIRASLDSNNATVEMGRLHKRIAELEAREVNLSKLSVGEVMHMSGFSRDYADGWCAGNDNAIHEIRTAGIKVKES
ncbi:ead/Ea22-like family protein [Salmonella enterica subsp. enterica serovar Agama]|uniref:Ead/Ea22-like family protein n=2 Tax=Salmonella enterica I TaxID=59201 RepID=A0A3U5FLY8_SALTM|nr:ead/Ea22-like family protein [Salmonella enterica subsp. enterica serovar Typhimurium]EAW1923376.1 ead/Ea22-like family protein [Salmonella enterica subsp. enterica]EAW3021660.1 ead/Ea22-like family protein [Salmonella enterica]EBF8626573.1 ead/Ea22-like family protein [Salmonella enterica subsp. enterica serovar Colindale]EBH9096306.1 ead/Ea22-like family protein [Salmonella enterica subsp. enterica serovar Orion]ECB3293426.1 ead/Ea22-like family protein [Salmonella enterica subsp. enteric